MDDENLIYVKFRYIFSGDDELEEHAMPTISELLAIINIDQRSNQTRVKYITIGLERLDKCGEKTNKHIHMHMLIDDNVGSIRKRLQRYFESRDEKRKGNCLYSLTQEDDVKDESRFFRYVFKQCMAVDNPRENKLLANYQQYPPDFDVVLQKKLAFDEWMRDIDFNLKKKADMLKPNTKDLLFGYLDNIHNTVGRLKTKVEILTFILMYYNQEEKSANQATIMGYLNTAIMRYGLMTAEQMAESWLK